MPKKVKDAIPADLKKSEMFQIISESLPTTFTYWSVDNNYQIYIATIRFNKREIFFFFFYFAWTKRPLGRNVAELAFKYHTDIEIDFRKCRGQSYDNTDTMYTTKNIVNIFAIFIPCTVNSLHLVNRSAFDSYADAVKVFRIIYDIYIYF